jgi:hypothetical protein
MKSSKLYCIFSPLGEIPKGEGVDYSYRNASTGFLTAALQLCQLTVIKAMTRAITPAIVKIHQLSSTL